MVRAPPRAADAAVGKPDSEFGTAAAEDGAVAQSLVATMTLRPTAVG